MAPNGQISTASGLRQRAVMRAHRPAIVAFFGLNPCPSDPSYAWLKQKGVTNIGEAIPGLMAVTDFGLSRH